MIKAEFFLTNEKLSGFSVRGHAGYADIGFDIVCSSVTSAVELTANAITEILGVRATVAVLENEVRLSLLDDSDGCDANHEAVNFLKALRLHLELLAKDYREHVSVADVDL